MADDRKILKEEIREIISSNPDHKKIILKSAKKLEQSPDYEEKSPTIISKRLSMVFKGHVTSRYVRKILPEKYKHSYGKNKTNPRNETEKLLLSQINSLRKSISELDQFIKDVQKNPHLAHVVRKKFPDQFYRKFIDQMKEKQIDFQLLRESLDHRRKFSAYQKVLLRMFLMDNSRNKVAKMFDCSTKYLKKIEEDEEITRGLEEIRKCPHCSFDFVGWFKENKLSEKLGEAMILPPGLQNI